MATGRRRERERNGQQRESNTRVNVIRRHTHKFIPPRAPSAQEYIRSSRTAIAHTVMYFKKKMGRLGRPSVESRLPDSLTTRSKFCLSLYSLDSRERERE